MTKGDRELTTCRTACNAKDVGGMVMYDVTKRLELYGYTLKDTDSYLLTVAFERVRGTIHNDCNVKDVPLGLRHVAADMTLGEFLRAKLTFSPDDLATFDLDVAVKQIQTGDTNTVFAVGGNDGSMTPEQRLNAYISYLLTAGRSEFSAYRRLRW